MNWAPGMLVFIAPQRRPTMDEIQLDAIRGAIASHRGDKTAAATELGISLKTIYNRLGAEALGTRRHSRH
jgi:transcriptional regulator with PAS, ATPase and Fis domain